MNKVIINLFQLLVLLLVNGSIFFYVNYLEKEHCDCIIDWRQKYIKYYVIAVIIINILLILLNNRLNIIVKSNILGFLLIASVVFFYSLFTYVGQLDKENCACAVKDNKNIHNILYYYRYLFYLQIAMVVLLILSSINFSTIIDDMAKKGKMVSFKIINKRPELIITKIKK